MTEDLAKQVLEKLKIGEIEEYRVEKDQFLTFQPVLYKHGGAIVFTYEQGWTA